MVEFDSTSRVRFEAIASSLRSRIVKGVMLPGSQLPTWDLLAAEFNVGRPTLMRAMDRLKKDGFVYSSSTRGTFVSDRPPHICRYAMVFGSSPERSGIAGWNRFWTALSQEAESLNRKGEKEIVPYHITPNPKSAAMKQLEEDVERHRLAGLIVVGTPDLMKSNVVQRHEVPTVAIYNGKDHPQVPRIYVDTQSFVDKAITYLRERSCQRVAVLRNQTDVFEAIDVDLLAAGFQTKPFWVLSVDGGQPEPAYNIVRLLMNAENAVRPDALIITDDNLVEHGLAALVKDNVRVPEILKVVAHCNWPAVTTNIVPTQRLGYDSRALLRQCLETIDQQRRGETTTPSFYVPAQLESDVSD